MERYEWVFIKKPEQAKAMPRSSRQRSPSPFSPKGASSSSNHLTVPKLEMIKYRLSPFLAIRHFKLPSKTASMFMSGTQEGIVIGNYAIILMAEIIVPHTALGLQILFSPICSQSSYKWALSIALTSDSGLSHHTLTLYGTFTTRDVGGTLIPPMVSSIGLGPGTYSRESCFWLVRLSILGQGFHLFWKGWHSKSSGESDS